ncbi:MAG: sigma-70 family RNA polymerase sigma factor [Polyangiaceae bacterium]
MADEIIEHEAASALVVRPAAFQDTGQARLVEAAQEGQAQAQAQLYDRFAPHAQRVLLRCLGSSDELADALQDVFVEVFQCIGKLRDPAALKAWITRVAVYVARARLRRRARRRWLRLAAPDDLPEIESQEADPEVREALRATYRVLDGLPADERIAFALRVIEGMALREVAIACDCSLATIKRRVRRAKQRFAEEARGQSALRPWLRGGAP